MPINIDELPEAELLELLEQLAGSARVRALGWRLREQAPPPPEKFLERNNVLRQLWARGQTLGQLRQRYGLARSTIWKIVEKRSPQPEASAAGMAE
jgi:hypothetical protein